MNPTTLAVIGGSGFYALPGAEVVREHDVRTPYGAPSSRVVELSVEASEGRARILFISRHGPGHLLAPHEVNYRANVAALKMLGADFLLSVAAVGSLEEAFAPGHFVVVDQYLDQTKRRESTFFSGGAVAHVSMADPVCPVLARALFESSRRVGATVHDGGTYVCIEGPQFSTRAESKLYRSFGASVIGMTAMPEAKLAREACLPYATLALVTDYDSWHETEADVSVVDVLTILRQNTSRAQEVVLALARALPDPTSSPVRSALDNALLSDRKRMPEAARAELSWLLG